MPKLIQKSRYFKPREKHSTAYLKYIATRDGVEKVTSHHTEHPQTQKQEQLIESILRDYPDSKELFEYEDYLAAPNIGNASDFISMVLDSHWDESASSNIYMKYIATRPRVEKRGGHGLFSDGDSVDLNEALACLSAYDGNVYTFILSLRREDAARLGYDSAAAWQSILKEHRNEIAEALKIPCDELHWYAAFHNESHHPHIHMMVYGNDPKTGYLNTTGIHKMRSALTNTIFKQEMLNLYTQKSVSRDELVQSARSAMTALIHEMQTGVCDSPEIAAQISALADQLQNEHGKMQYGYLKHRLKTMVDEIVDELERIPSVAECYRNWLTLRDAVQNYYSGDTPEYIPLSRQKEFKQIRNMVIREAVGIANGVVTFEDDAEPKPVLVEPDAEITLPPDSTDTDDPPSENHSDSGSVYVDWTYDYKTALEYLYGTESAAPDFEQALALMTAEAENGNALAMYDLAKMFANGLGCNVDEAAAHAWYAKALSAFKSCEAKKPWRYTQSRIGKLYAAGLGTEQDYEKAFDLYSDSAWQGFPYASYELAKMFRDGIGVSANPQKADAEFRLAFSGFVALEKRSHDEKLQYRIGQMLLTSTGTEKDVDRAATYFEKSARLGNGYVQYQLAKLYLADDAADDEKIQQAISWLEQSAEGENQFAQYALGKIYRDGTHVPQDERRAAELFTAAAEQGNEYAVYALGKLYLGTETMANNIPGALRWLGVAAEVGNQFAQYTLGKLYLAGENVPKDTGKAVSYLTPSAEQDNQYAQYALGKLYLLGKDVPQDKETALRWLELSAAQGNLYAQFFIDHASDHTEPSALLSATQLLHHLGGIFRSNALPPGNAKGIRIDSKRRRKLHEMKVAAGHAEDEHDSEYTQIMSY